MRCGRSMTVACSCRLLAYLASGVGDGSVGGLDVVFGRCGEFGVCRRVALRAWCPGGGVAGVVVELYSIGGFDGHTASPAVRSGSARDLT